MRKYQLGFVNLGRRMPPGGDERREPSRRSHHPMYYLMKKDLFWMGVFFKTLSLVAVTVLLRVVLGQDSAELPWPILYIPLGVAVLGSFGLWQYYHHLCCKGLPAYMGNLADRVAYHTARDPEEYKKTLKKRLDDMFPDASQ